MESGRIANRFSVLAELGSGGMGTVYRVADTLDDDREVALKTFRSDVPTTPERRLRFREEFRAMAKLRHPNTVEVYDCGFLDGQTEYLTMEYVPGRELNSLIDDEPAAFEQIYDIALQLLLALEFIHSRLYVHRDIKPSNLRVRPDGVLKVMDFGLMEWSGSRASAGLIGTAGYMAPEIILGGALDTASDLYSVGCLLYELASGRVPFLGTKSETLEAHLFQTPDPLRFYRPDTPAGFEAIVRRLLAKELRERYETAAEVADDIAALAGVRRIRQDIARNESYLVSDVMVGREREFGEIEAMVADVTGGHSRSVYVGGSAGVGKSRLVHETLIQCKLRGMQVLSATCKAGSLPYEPLVAALRPLLSLSTSEELGDRQDLLDRLEDLATSQVLEAEGSFDKLELAEEVNRWLLGASAGTPLVLVTEDLQWADRPTLELLNHCVRAGGEGRVLFAASLRSDEASLDSPLWFTVQDGLTEHLELQPFDPGQTRELVHSMLPRLKLTDAFIKALYDATAGNAFFVTEVLRDLMEQGVLVSSEDHWALPSDWSAESMPKSIETVVLERLSRLSDEALELARVASVLNRSLDRESLLELSGLDEDELFATVEALTERQFLTREDRRYAFPHDRVRESLYADMPVAQRRDLHQRCGQYLERRYAEQIDAQLGELAYHFSNGEDQAKALDYTLRAGDQAKRSGADASAIEHWSAAVELLDEQDHPNRDALRFDLKFQISENGLVLWPAKAMAAADWCREQLEARGNINRACRFMKGVVGVISRLPAKLRAKIFAEMMKPVAYHHEEATRWWQRLLPPPIPSWVPKVLETYTINCVAAGLAGEPLRGIPLGESALFLLPFKGTTLEGAMRTAVAGCLQSAGHFDGMGETLVHARENLFDVEIGDESFAQSARVGAAVFCQYGVYQGQRFDDELVKYGTWCVDKMQKPDFYNQVWSYPCLWYAFTGRYEQAVVFLDKIESNCRRIGSPLHPWALFLKPYLAWQRGSHEEARALVSRALRYPAIKRMMLARECACVLEGRILLDLGELEAAEETLMAVEARARNVGMDYVIIQALIALGVLAARRDELGHAQRKLEESVALSAEGPARNPLQWAIAKRELASVFVAQGSYGPAQACIDDARGVFEAAEQDNRVEQGLLLCVEAELALGLDEAGDALSALARAEACFDKLRNSYLVRVTRNRRVAAGLSRESEPIARGRRTLDPRDAAPADAETADLVATVASIGHSEGHSFSEEGLFGAPRHTADDEDMWPRESLQRTDP